MIHLQNYVLFVMVSNKVALMSQTAIQTLPFKYTSWLLVQLKHVVGIIH